MKDRKKIHNFKEFHENSREVQGMFRKLYCYIDCLLTVHMPRVLIGPALFFTCPIDVEKSQKWFGEVWNNTIVPYLSQLNKEFTVRVRV